jgi:hypothetical protein
MRLVIPHRAATGLTALTVIAASAVSFAPVASAAAGLDIAYDVSGASMVAKTDSTIALGPAQLSASIAPSGSFVGSIDLPPTSTSFNALGLLPTSATVTFVAAGATTGKMVSSPKPKISATASYYVALSDVTVAGLPIPVGSQCETAQPVSMTLTGKFSVVKGGTVKGSYTIGDFANCGLTTFLLNALIPGPGNTISLTLSHGRLLPS